MVQPYTIETHGGRAYKRTFEGIVVMATPEEQMTASYIEELQKQIEEIQKQIEAAKANATKIPEPSQNGRPPRTK